MRRSSIVLWFLECSFGSDRGLSPERATRLGAGLGERKGALGGIGGGGIGETALINGRKHLKFRNLIHVWFTLLAFSLING